MCAGHATEANQQTFVATIKGIKGAAGGSMTTNPQHHAPAPTAREQAESLVYAAEFALDRVEGDRLGVARTRATLAVAQAVLALADAVRESISDAVWNLKPPR